jgi:hypothetical protein
MHRLFERTYSTASTAKWEMKNRVIAAAFALYLALRPPGPGRMAGDFRVAVAGFAEGVARHVAADPVHEGIALLEAM